MVQKRNRITLELQTDDDRIFNLYKHMNSNGTLSDFIEALVTLRINNFEAKVASKQPDLGVKSDNNSGLTFNDSILNLLYDLKETMEEIKETSSAPQKSELDLDSVKGVFKDVIDSIPKVAVHAQSVSSISDVTPPLVAPVEEVKEIDLGYLDNEMGTVVKTHKTDDSASDCKPAKKKSMKGMNMAKLKKLKGG